MPLVSIIIPVYKSINVLRTAVHSVQAQAYNDFEIILVDDGSPDNSFELCKKLQQEDSRIKVFQKENGGICSARNYGMEKATGKYIAFLDHDDEYLPGYLKDNIELLEKYDADIIKFERLRETHNLDNSISVLHGDRIKNMPLIEDRVVCYEGTEIAKRFPEIRKAVKIMYIWDGIYNRNFLRTNCLKFDESFKFGHEDIMFNLDVLSVARKMVFHAKEYYKHKYREATSTSAVFNKSRIKDTIKTAKRECDLLTAWNYPEEQILLSYMNELYRVLNILSLPSVNCSEQEKSECLAQFKENTIDTLKKPSDAVKKLMKLQWSHGILAWLFMRQRYRICLGLFKVYHKHQK